MEHSNGLQWFVNVILKFGFVVECLIIKRNYKRHNENRKSYAISKLCNLFTSGKKTLVKPWNKIFHYTTALFHMTFKSKCEPNDKSCFTARAGEIHLHLCDIWNVHSTSYKIFFPCIWLEFINKHGTSLFYVSSVW